MTAVKDTVEFSVPQENLHLVYRWYADVAEGDLKRAIYSIRYLHSFESYCEIAVLCRHPFGEELKALDAARLADRVEEADIALQNLIRKFRKWVEKYEPAATRACDPMISVRWWPYGVSSTKRPLSSPQLQAQLDMNDHALDCLELIRFAILDSRMFVKLWRGTNEPFFAAGLLAYSRLEWLKIFPTTWSDNQTRDDLFERLERHARVFLGLFRMAQACGYKSKLTREVSTVLFRFRKAFVQNLSEWDDLATQCLAHSTRPLEPLAIFHPGEYSFIDAAADMLRRDLAFAATNHVDLIPEMVNSFLIHLPAPESSAYFDLDSLPFNH
jgi:hypothetical protein